MMVSLSFYASDLVCEVGNALFKQRNKNGLNDKSNQHYKRVEVISLFTQAA